MDDVSVRLEILESKIDHIERMISSARRWAIIRFFVFTVFPIALVSILAVPAVQKIQTVLRPYLSAPSARSSAMPPGVNVQALCRQLCQ